LQVWPSGHVGTVHVRGCADPFAEAVRVALATWTFAPWPAEEPVAFALRGEIRFRTGRKGPAVTWELFDVTAPIHEANVPYPEALLQLGVLEIDCQVRIRVGTDGAPSAFDLDACPEAAHEDLTKALLGWRWSPPDWPDGPGAFVFPLRVKYRLRGGEVAARPLDAADAWEPPPRPPGVPEQVGRLTASSAPPKRTVALDWANLRGAIPDAGTTCPVVVLVDPRGKPATADFAGCPEALQRPTWDVLRLWRWEPRLDETGAGTWFEVSLALRYQPPE
jgi:hypothetical protein